MRILLGFLALLASASSAFADPISASIVAAIGLSGAAATVATTAITLALTVGATWAANKFFGPKADQGQQQPEPGGVQLDLRVDADVPQSLIVGRAVTAGSLVYAETYGVRGDIDNSDLIQIIALADHPITAIQETYVESQLVSLTALPGGSGTTGVGAANRGYGVEAGYDFKIAFGQYLGDQTAADALAVAALGSHPERPWTADYIGRGTAYVRVHTVYDREKMTGPLPVKFVVDGIKLYDPRLDTTVGGSGAHRWGDLDTHEFTANLAVIAYNILRGIRVKDHEGTPQHFYGLEGTPAANLPLDNWFAAMNECDVVVDDEPQYHGGAEIGVDTEPLDAIRQILKACDGRLSELGGVYKLRVGAPGLPVLSFTDADLRANEGDTFRPITPLERRVNHVTAKYTAPEDGWVPKVAAPRLDPEAEAEDGRRLSADLDVPWVQSPTHVQRLQKQMLLRSRRQRRHVVPLPPGAFGLEPGDPVEWNSERNGYIDKLFELEAVELHANLDSTVTLLEIDPDDYDWDGETDYIPQPVGSLVANRPAPKVIEGFDADGFIHIGDNGIKRAAIKVTWDAPQDGDIARVEIQVRRSVSIPETATFTTEEPAAEEMIILASIAPATTYEVRGRFRSANDYEAEWSLWEPVTTPDVTIAPAELSEAILEMQRIVNARFENIEDIIGSVVGRAEIRTAEQLIERAGHIGGLVRAVTGVETDYNGKQTHAASVQQEFLAFAGPTGVFSIFRTDLRAALTGAVDEFDGETTLVSTIRDDFVAFAGPDGTYANKVIELESALTGDSDTIGGTITLAASVRNELTTFAGPGGAYAQDKQAITAAINGSSATIFGEQTAAADLYGRVAALWTMKVETGGDGFSHIAAIQLGADTEESAIRMRADRFALTLEGYPHFTFTLGAIDGVTKIGMRADQVLIDASVVARNIAASAVTADKLVANSVDALILRVGGIDFRHIIDEAVSSGTRVTFGFVNLSAGDRSIVTGSLTTKSTKPVELILFSPLAHLAAGSSDGVVPDTTFEFKVDGSTNQTITVNLPGHSIAGAAHTYERKEQLNLSLTVSGLSVGSHSFEFRCNASTLNIAAGHVLIRQIHH